MEVRLFSRLQPDIVQFHPFLVPRLRLRQDHDTWRLQSINARE